jgi:hypothetical protein
MSCIICDTAAGQPSLVQCSSCKITICTPCKNAFYYYMADYKCEACNCINKSVKPICLLCSQQDKPSIIKPTIFNREDRWCHISCAMWYSNIDIGPCITNMSSIPVECWNSTCSLCKKETCTCLVKCKQPECKVFAHLKCTNKILNYKNGKPSFIFLCKSHQPLDHIPTKIQAPKAELKHKVLCEWCNQEIVKDYLICKKCQQIVHKACYGKGNENTGLGWLCQMCKGTGIGNCILCGNNKGVLKEIDGGHIHLFCAKVVGGFTDKEKILQKCKSLQQGECCFCKKSKGYVIKCDVCDKRLHHYCYFSFCVAHNIKQRNIFYCSRHIFFKVALENKPKSREKIMKEISKKRKRLYLEKSDDKKEENECNWDFFNQYFVSPVESLNCLKDTLDVKCLSDYSEQFLSKKYIDVFDKSPTTNEYLNVVYKDCDQPPEKLYLLYFKVKKVEPREADLTQLPNFSITHITERKATRPQVNKYISHDLTLCDAVSVPHSLYNEIENMSICSTRVRRCYENSNIKGKYDELLYDLLIGCEDFKMKHSEVKQIKKKVKKLIKCELEKQYTRNSVPIEKEYMQVQRKTLLRHNLNESLADSYALQAPEETQVNVEYCQICFNAEAGRHNPLLFCGCCGLAVHQFCYGVHKADNFLCSKCKQMENTKDRVECAICGSSQGILKHIDKKWVHITCILFSPKLRILDYERMKGIDGVIPESSINECSFCHSSKGLVEKCNYCSSSGLFSHMMCAYLNGLCIKSIDNPCLPSFGLTFYFLCGSHSGPRDKEKIEQNRKTRCDNTEILNCSEMKD